MTYCLIRAVYPMDMAKDKAEQEYNIFNKHQKINSDFDKFSKKILEQSKNN